MKERFDSEKDENGNYVVAFTGEGGSVKFYKNCTEYCGYKKADGTPFKITGYYVGVSSEEGSSTLQYDGHPGYDYPVKTGTPVYAAASGPVTADTDPNGNTDAGKYVRIQHIVGSEIYQTQYLHLSEVLVSENDTVTKGKTIIGKSGNTGKSFGAHLHFEVKKLVDGNYVSIDPYGWEGTGTDPYKWAAHNDKLWEAISSTIAVTSFKINNNASSTTSPKTSEV